MPKANRSGGRLRKGLNAAEETYEGKCAAHEAKMQAMRAEQAAETSRAEGTDVCIAAHRLASAPPEAHDALRDELACCICQAITALETLYPDLASITPPEVHRARHPGPCCVNELVMGTLHSTSGHCLHRSRSCSPIGALPPRTSAWARSRRIACT